MLTKIKTLAYFGLSGTEVEVEVNIADKGFPGISMVGLVSKHAEEAKERVKTAIINSDIEFPMAKITINLAPADLVKDGSGFDLPIAMGILASAGEVDVQEKDAYFFGELSLDGSTRHTKGVFLLAATAHENGVKNIFVPRLCANEAIAINGVTVYPVDSLKSLILHFRGQKLITPLNKVATSELINEVSPEYDFCEIQGQESAKRALEIAAAGGHNVFMIGPPGSGKTMLSRAVPGIMPPLTEGESLEVTKIFSITGNIPAGASLVRNRPFRNPHHTTSLVGLIGGGSIPHPGEVSLAHRGILFLDEFPEFTRTTLEALRQPIEDGVVNISRSAGRLSFPAKFMLVAAANPCPCGFLGDLKKECKCTVNQILNYQKKLSGPIMDRIDIHLTVPAVDVNKLMIRKKNVSGATDSKTIRHRVINARIMQQKRFDGFKGIYCNADMKNVHLDDFAFLSTEANTLLKQAVNKFGLSARTYFRLIKVSRTVADLDCSSKIMQNHVAEALQYRIRSE